MQFEVQHGGAGDVGELVPQVIGAVEAVSGTGRSGVRPPDGLPYRGTLRVGDAPQKATTILADHDGDVRTLEQPAHDAKVETSIPESDLFAGIG